MRPIPKRKNCRAQYDSKIKSTLLIDYTDGKDAIIYTRTGIHSIGQIYSEFMFSINGYLGIDNFPYSSYTMPFEKVERGVYIF